MPQDKLIPAILIGTHATGFLVTYFGTMDNLTVVADQPYKILLERNDYTDEEWKLHQDRTTEVVRRKLTKLQAEGRENEYLIKD